ncbi:hypothetical protein LIER_29463 [Lithospermum erythrorhizon]|uniref:Integrase catalytic domain-containing protein n=1 Tax=Lithospermum erythrorhizon TaxID=34254 RepID=A0AAV3RML7_LITER
MEEIADPQGFEWSLHVDGARNDKGVGAGVLIASPHRITMEYALRFEFPAINSEAGYEAMIVGLKLVKSLNITKFLVKGDSKLVIAQLQGKCGGKNEVLKRYHSRVVSLTQGFARIRFRHIPREENEEADRLSRLATTYYIELLEGVFVEICNRPAYEEIYQEELYRKAWDWPLLLCVSAEDIPKILVEVHQGWCGSHIEARSLAIKITRARYYWPILVKDALSYLKKCDVSQRLGNTPQQPAFNLTPVVSPIPFAMWGIDLVGKLPQGKGGVEFAIVVVDYFSKW